MKQYTLKLDNTRQRPVVILNNGLTALLYTEAYIPVWTDDEDIHIEIPDWESNVRNLKVVNEGGKVFVLCSAAES